MNQAIHLRGHESADQGLRNETPNLTSRAKAIENGRVDTRVMPVVIDTNGRRDADLKAVLDQCVDYNPDDWPVLRPKTCVWLLTHFYRNGGGPMGFHHRWMSECRLEYTAAGTQEHLAWCRFFEILTTYDMIDPGKLASCELGARKLQMIMTSGWRHKLPRVGNPDKDSTIDDDAHLLMGTSENRGNIAMAPSLQKWLGEELGKEALASKERRKAREERALAVKKT